MSVGTARGNAYGCDGTESVRTEQVMYRISWDGGAGAVLTLFAAGWAETCSL